MDINFNEIFETSIFNSSIYTVFILEVTEREGCTLRCLHWKIACLPSNTIWLINCISFPKGPNMFTFVKTRIAGK